jgi:hypothetical protein
VVGDVVAAARDLAGGAAGGVAAREHGPPPADAAEAEAELYLRIEVADDPDAAGTVALLLEDRGVGVEQSLVTGRDVIILTRSTPRGMVDRALETLDTHPVVTRVAAALDRLPEAW